MHSPDRQHLPGGELLRLARGSIEHGSLHGRPLRVSLDDLPAVLAAPAATFTTLRLDDKLRGCCGTLEAVRPLAEAVTHSAFQAAFRDTRFDPVRRDEVERVRLEVSVLSPPEIIIVSDEADLLQQLAPGEDGLIIVEGLRRATFLPKVWESLPDPRQFLAQLKLKCGLPKNYWSDQLAFQRYRTTSFAEPV
ncbi:MAG TPA: AmmeMemoRadiSam system protein A [Woeseiaceae bacterium]